MQRRTFAPVSKNHMVPNPEIDFDAHGMQVQTECEPFPDHPVVVGINSFGFGGSNGHCVLREYRPEQPRIWSLPLAPRAGFMIPLSARTSGAQVDSARSLRAALDEQPADLYTLAGNLSRRRTHFAARRGVRRARFRAAQEALDAFVETPEPVATVDEGRRRLLMVFTGQGTQWAGCGRALLRRPPGVPARGRRHRGALARALRQLVASSRLRGAAGTAQRMPPGAAGHLHAAVRAGRAVQDLGGLSRLRGRPQLR